MKSRYIKTRSSPLGKKPRSRKLHGAFEDSGKYIRCWNCKAILDTSHLTTGRGSGVTHEDFDFEDLNVVSSGDTDKILLTLDSISMEGVLLEKGADAASITDYYTPRKAVAIGGCWLCGTKNLP